MDLFLIDTLSPFFAPLPDGEEYNWSKVPFTLLEGPDGLDVDKEIQIIDAFGHYVRKVSGLGYNAVTIDELCRMVDFDFYNAALRRKLEGYRSFYKKIFSIAAENNLKIYVTTDIMFFNRDIEEYLGKRRKKESIKQLLRVSIEKLFREYPGISGVVFRLGESDGMDVEGDFISRLFIKKPEQCRKVVHDLIPLFEEKDKTMIVRTWTLGAYPIGDLIWNRATLDKVFRNMDSENLIISHKFGEGDFFRYMNLNPHFYDEGTYRKIIELQAKREYEGFGEFPSYVGREYEKFSRYLKQAENMQGIMVWAQTGGWSHFNRLTYGRRSSLWVEINIEVIIALFRDELKSEEAVYRFAERNPDLQDGEKLLELLKLSDRVVRNLWYLPEFSSRRMYFRRNRIPPLLWNVWDNILISHSLRSVIRLFVLEKKEAVLDGYRFLRKIKRMKKLACELGIDTEQFDFMYDTFRIVALGREYYLSRWNPGFQEKLSGLSAKYRKKYPGGFHIIEGYALVQPKKWIIRTLFVLAIRNYPQYRLIDKLVLIRFSSLIYLLVSLFNRKKLPAFLEEKAMGVQTLLK
ncbi:MAG: hypothetical protein JXR86_00810 [Spirochaetales bacterium]|nr:hypothetical protein [Spirochaetales bacterium]